MTTIGQEHEIKPLNIVKQVYDYQCLDCDSQITVIAEFDDIKSAEKVKRHLCLNCRSDKLVKTCPECGSIGLLFDDKRAELSCHDCGTVIECPPPYYKDGMEVVPFSQVISDNITVDTNLSPRSRTYRPGLKHWKKAERDVLGDGYD